MRPVRRRRKRTTKDRPSGFEAPWGPNPGGGVAVTSCEDSVLTAGGEDDRLAVAWRIRPVR